MQHPDTGHVTARYEGVKKLMQLVSKREQREQETQEKKFF